MSRQLEHEWICGARLGLEGAPLRIVNLEVHGLTIKEVVFAAGGHGLGVDVEELLTSKPPSAASPSISATPSTPGMMSPVDRSRISVT
ncbi:MAG: hypothetical protein AAF439_11940 [Pseudomonadota bacterium]